MYTCGDDIYIRFRTYACSTRNETRHVRRNNECVMHPRFSRIREILFECFVDDENEFSMRRRLGARTKKISLNLVIYAAANWYFRT